MAVARPGDEDGSGNITVRDERRAVSSSEPTRREWTILTLGAAALALVDHFTSPTLFDSIDWDRIHAFYKDHLAAAWQAGRLPQWNPHVMLGRPFLADFDATLFYPPTLLYAFLDQHVAAGILTALHLLIGLWGMVRLARALGVDARVSLALAFVFAAGGPLVASYQSGVVNYANAMCYLPLVLSLAVGLQDAAPGRASLRAAAWLALALGLQLLSGHPQMSWVTGLGAALFMIGRRLEGSFRPAAASLARDLGWLAAAVGASVSLAAAQVLPIAELMGQSNRNAPSIAFAASYALPAAGFGSLVIPGGPSHRAPAPDQLYVGIAVLLAALGGLALWRRDRNVRALALVASVAALIAVGDRTPFFRVFFHVIPALSKMRIHSRAAVLVCLPIVLTAGIFLSDRTQRRGRFGVLWLWAMGATALAASSLALRTFFPGMPPLLSLARAPWILAALALLTAWHLRDTIRSRWGAPAVGVALLALTAGDLGFATMGLKRSFADFSRHKREATVRARLERGGFFTPDGVPPRAFVPPPHVRENASMAGGYSMPTGYVALQLGRVWDHIHAMQGLEAPLLQNTYPAWAPGTGPFPFHSMNLVLGVDPRVNKLVTNPDPDPRSYVTYAAVVEPDFRRANRRMYEGHDFHRIALVEAALPGLPADVPADAAPATARITHFEPEALEVDVESARPGLLVLAEPWFPGWTATVDGNDVPCVPANGWMRGVPLAAGHSKVVLRYASTYLKPGLALSFATLALILAALYRTRRPRPAAAVSP